MADPMAVAMARYRARQRIVRAATARAMRSWRGVDRASIRASWAAALPDLVLLLSAAQLAAADGADAYADAVLVAQGIDLEPVGRVRPEVFSGVASDGRPLPSLLAEPAIITLSAISQGATMSRALRSGGFALTRIMETQIADAGRVADGITVTTRPRVGYVRMLNPPSCSRCAILAGRFYRWNAGFRRHPRCDCVHIPAQDDTSGDLRTSPEAYFRSLSRAEQDRVFTHAGAEAIRDGADIFQVVNARRGAVGLTPAGARITRDEARMLRGGRDRGALQRVDVFRHPLFVTTEGVTVRGIAGRLLGARETGVRNGTRFSTARTPRLMPESIYEIAENREDAIRLLRRFGYIT